MKFYENLTMVDRFLRVTIGCSLIVAMLLNPVSSAFVLAMSLGAWYPLVTALIGWDPIYSLVEHMPIKFKLETRTKSHAA